MGNNKLTEALTFINNLMEQGHYFMLDYDLVGECELDEATQERLKFYREYFELTLQMLAPYCNEHVEKEAIGKKIFSQYHNQ